MYSFRLVAASVIDMRPFVFSTQTQQLHAARKKRQQQLNEVMPTHQHERIAGKDEGAAARLWESLKTTVFRENCRDRFSI